MNAAARDAIQRQLTATKERLGHDEAEVRDLEGSLNKFKAHVSVQRQTIVELKEALEEEES